MEKLQIAIEHARKRRESKEAKAPPKDRTADEGAVNLVEQPDDAWAALKPFAPNARTLARNRIVVENDDGGAKTAIDILRTRLLTMMRANDWTRVMLTSPTSGCGKSTLAANLAMSLQRQEDLKILLIDLDLQQMSLGDKLGLSPEKGVADFLSGSVSATDQFHRIGENLAVSVGRSRAIVERELLKSAGAQRQIDAAEAALKPDIVLFDMPPVFATDDTIFAAGFVDCAVVIGAAEQTTIAELEEVEQDLAQYTNIAGVVLNKSRFAPKHAGYGYKYR